MPNFSFTSRYCDSTMSRIVNFGNCIRGWALELLGEVVSPFPIASVQMMKYLSGSSAFPGPIMKSIRWWLPEIAVTIRMALDFSAFSLPWVTKEMEGEVLDSLAALQREIPFAIELMRRLLSC